MTTKTQIQTLVLVGLLAVSLALYWAAEADQAVIEIGGLAVIVILALVALIRR